MHDLDRTFMEREAQAEAFEFTGETESNEVFQDHELQELAAELLSVQNEDELNYFLGDLIKKAGRSIGRVVESPVGQAIGGVLKNVAKQALPLAGTALGNMLVPGVGGALGGQLASGASSLMGLEMEGLSQEDREFEVAKQYVRLAADTAANAIQSAQQGQNVQQAVKDAVTQAAQKFAPGLVQTAPPAQASDGVHRQHHKHHGRWVRQGNQIVLLGV
jgi:hypothetical protein